VQVLCIAYVDHSLAATWIIHLPSSYGESTDFATIGRKNGKTRPRSPKVVPSDWKSSPKVARRQSQMLGSQRLLQVSQLALFVKSHNPVLTYLLLSVSLTSGCAVEGLPVQCRPSLGCWSHSLYALAANSRNGGNSRKGGSITISAGDSAHVILQQTT